LPTTGDSVWIPSGMHLLVDVSSTPVLNLVLVEGSLIFPPDDSDSSSLATFDATYIFVHGGYMEVGTEDFPYTSKLIITMHGDKYTPEIPIFGSKCIAVMMGDLEMHGVPRTPTWTSLYTTANSGDNTITLNTAVDWVAGEEIIIAPTGYDPFEAEGFTIVSVDRSNVNAPVITLNDTLYYTHYAGI
jgi:G8 domain